MEDINLRKYTPEEKIKLILEFEKGDIPKQTYARSKGINVSTFRGWLMIYKRYGIDGLSPKKSNHYTYETKIKAVSAYKNHEGTLEDIAMRFGLRATNQLRNWLIQYNNDKNLTATPVRKKVVTVSKKTTLEERIKIVEYMILEHHTYSEASEHFKVSYQQARNWKLLVENSGYSSLADNRGQKKYIDEEKLSEVEKLKLENRSLKAQLNEHKAIEAFEKKFNEIQHGE